jgi:hypothetical protein
MSDKQLQTVFVVAMWIGLIVIVVSALLSGPECIDRVTLESVTC